MHSIAFQQQQLIELIRDGRVEEALKFASEQLAERGEEEPLVLEELERTLALLAFEDPSQSPFSDLLSLSHRQKVWFWLLGATNIDFGKFLKLWQHKVVIERKAAEFYFANLT